MSYLPIEDYGLIGNMHTVALVSKQGAIDWFCPRKFDDASIFGAILDAEKGGTFVIRPDQKTEYKSASYQFSLYSDIALMCLK